MISNLISFIVIAILFSQINQTPSLLFLTFFGFVFGGILAFFSFKKFSVFQENRSLFPKQKIYRSLVLSRMTEAKIMLLKENEFNREFWKAYKRTLIPPFLVTLEPEKLSNLLFYIYFDGYRNLHLDVVFRIIRTLDRSRSVWNLETIYECLLNPSMFVDQLNQYFQFDDAIFFDAVAQGILKIDQKFLWNFKEVAARLKFLFSDYRPPYWVSNYERVFVFADTQPEDIQLLSQVYSFEFLNTCDIKLFDKKSCCVAELPIFSMI